MKNKIITFAAPVLILLVALLYLGQNYFSSGSRTVKYTYTDPAGCVQNHDTKAAGGDVSTYEFVTDKACTNEQRETMQSKLMGVSGVTDVKIGPSCSVSKMSEVTVYFSTGQTSAGNLASFIKDNGLDCSKMGDCPPGSCPHKSKTKDTKSI